MLSVILPTLEYLTWGNEYSGSVGQFRYKVDPLLKEDPPLLEAATYSRVCYEKASDRVSQRFPATEEGLDELHRWIDSRLAAFQAGTLAVPAPPAPEPEDDPPPF